MDKVIDNVRTDAGFIDYAQEIQQLTGIEEIKAADPEIVYQIVMTQHDNTIVLHDALALFAQWKPTVNMADCILAACELSSDQRPILAILADLMWQRRLWVEDSITLLEGMLKQLIISGTLEQQKYRCLLLFVKLSKDRFFNFIFQNYFALLSPSNISFSVEEIYHQIINSVIIGKIERFGNKHGRICYFSANVSRSAQKAFFQLRNIIDSDNSYAQKIIMLERLLQNQVFWQHATDGRENLKAICMELNKGLKKHSENLVAHGYLTQGVLHMLATQSAEIEHKSDNDRAIHQAAAVGECALCNVPALIPSETPLLLDLNPYYYYRLTATDRQAAYDYFLQTYHSMLTGRGLYRLCNQNELSSITTSITNNIYLGILHSEEMHEVNFILKQGADQRWYITVIDPTVRMRPLNHLDTKAVIEPMVQQYLPGCTVTYVMVNQALTRVHNSYHVLENIRLILHTAQTQQSIILADGTFDVNVLNPCDAAVQISLTGDFCYPFAFVQASHQIQKYWLDIFKLAQWQTNAGAFAQRVTQQETKPSSNRIDSLIKYIKIMHRERPFESKQICTIDPTYINEVLIFWQLHADQQFYAPLFNEIEFATYLLAAVLQKGLKKQFIAANERIELSALLSEVKEEKSEAKYDYASGAIDVDFRVKQSDIFNHALMQTGYNKIFYYLPPAAQVAWWEAFIGSMQSRLFNALDLILADWAVSPRITAADSLNTLVQQNDMSRVALQFSATIRDGVLMKINDKIVVATYSNIPQICAVEDTTEAQEQEIATANIGKLQRLFAWLKSKYNDTCSIDDWLTPILCEIETKLANTAISFRQKLTVIDQQLGRLFADRSCYHQGECNPRHITFYLRVILNILYPSSDTIYLVRPLMGFIDAQIIDEHLIIDSNKWLTQEIPDDIDLDQWPQPNRVAAMQDDGSLLARINMSIHYWYAHTSHTQELNIITELKQLAYATNSTDVEEQLSRIIKVNYADFALEPNMTMAIVTKLASAYSPPLQSINIRQVEAHYAERYATHKATTACWLSLLTPVPTALQALQQWCQLIRSIHEKPLSNSDFELNIFEYEQLKQLAPELLAANSSSLELKQ